MTRRQLSTADASAPRGALSAILTESGASLVEIDVAAYRPPARDAG